MITNVVDSLTPDSIKLERSFGTASGFDVILQKLRRFLEYQLQRFVIHNGIKGRWSLVVYVSREDQ